MQSEHIQWLLESDEPWTRYRTRLDLLEMAQDDTQVQADRNAMLTHPLVKELIKKAAGWPVYPLKRHNDAKHPLYVFSTLADFGLKASDPGMQSGIKKVLAHQSKEGAFETIVQIPKVFGGTGDESWNWMACDAPTLLYSLLALGLEKDTQVKLALNHLISLLNENGWRCAATPALGSKFKGPGSREDPCPIANVYALKAISMVPELLESEAAKLGTEMLLAHWKGEGKRKYFLFGVGTDFRKLKCPFIWYDILHVAEVLSRFSFTHDDTRMQSMVHTIIDQADENKRYTATSMYRAWKDWSFANKKTPSPWLTFLAYRIIKRVHGSMKTIE